MNIFLVGFMGTGKTAVAKEVAGLSELHYIEMDELIEKRESRSISDIFKSDGEAYFRNVEKEILREITLQDNQVVSCGGGVVIDIENINLMKEAGLLICLEAEPAVIFQRIKDEGHRPLLNVNNPQQKIEELLIQRKPFYEKADFTINTTNLNINQVAHEVLKHLSE
jgi:shikimate kinase